MNLLDGKKEGPALSTGEPVPVTLPGVGDDSSVVINGKRYVLATVPEAKAVAASTAAPAQVAVAAQQYLTPAQQSALVTLLTGPISRLILRFVMIGSAGVAGAAASAVDPGVEAKVAMWAGIVATLIATGLEVVISRYVHRPGPQPAPDRG